MKVFLSWSGDRSKAVALALRDWLPLVLQAIDPWMSAEDIGKGERWSEGISSALKESKVGILCVTPENAQSTWLNFEAGAISREVQSTYVCPVLLDMKPSDLRPPLGQFQATTFVLDDILRLVQTLNSALSPDRHVTSALAEKSARTYWPELEKAVRAIPPPAATAPPARSDHDLLVEILEGVRQLSRALPAEVALTANDIRRLLIKGGAVSFAKLSPHGDEDTTQPTSDGAKQFVQRTF